MLSWLRRNRISGSATPAPIVEGSPAAPQPEAPRQTAAVADDLMRRAFPLHQAGNVAGAEQIYRDILVLNPDYADAHYLLGRIAQGRGQFEDAMQHVRRAIRCNSGEPAFHRTLGELHFLLGHWEEAIVCYGDIADSTPTDLEAWNNLGCCHEKLGRLAEARRCFEKALELSPDSPMALNNVGNALRDSGRADDAIERLRKAHQLAPADKDIFSNYLYALTFTPRVTARERFEAHLEFDAVFGTGRFGKMPGPDTGFDPDRRLRIGYVSPDLRSHPISVFLEGPLIRHDRKAFEVTCYHLHSFGDLVTDRLRRLSDRWVECRGLGDEQLAERITQDRIDILVDLAGHTGDNGLPVLGRKPAPVLATWLGYPNTTGLRSVDHKITDAVCDPEGQTERYHTEALVRLPQQWCFARPQVTAEVTPLPALASGGVRFGSFNNASKLTDEMLQLWVRILQRVEHSTLLVWGVGDEPSERVRQLLRDAGLDPARATFSGRTPFQKQVAMYQGVDVALDTFPYSGVTTTFNSLWMGVPVITLAGETSASRSTFSILSGLGLQDWGAHSSDEYLEIAVRKARDPGSLAMLRARLQGVLEGSAFMDAAGFTRRLEEAYRQMWRARCRTAASA